LSEVSFSVSGGEWLGILGPNGSGKTTLLKILCGILKPQNGKVELNDRSLGQYSQNEIAKIIGVVPQDAPILYPFSTLEIVLMGRTPYQKSFGFESAGDIEIVRRAMELTDTWQFRDRPIQELSGGERQRAIIARAIAQEPKILLLDEPTAFLDIKHQKEISNLLSKLNREHGMTIISVMHDINLASLYCNRIMLLKNGGITKIGSVEETITYANIKDVFETEVYVGINDLTKKPYYMLMDGKK